MSVSGFGVFRGGKMKTGLAFLFALMVGVIPWSIMVSPNIVRAAAIDDGGGGMLPWPWGSELVFPWRDIEGVWQAKTEGPGVPTYFSFRVIREFCGERVIIVKQLAADKKKVLAVGIGTETNRVVKGEIYASEEKLEITVRAYKGDSNQGRVMVMTLADSLNRLAGVFEYVFLEKISNQPIDADTYGRGKKKSLESDNAAGVHIMDHKLEE